MAANPTAPDAHIQEALQETEALGLDFRYVIDKLHLVKITDDISRTPLRDWQPVYPLWQEAVFT